MTTTVLPRSTSRCSTSSSFSKIAKVQSGRRLVEQIKRSPGVGPGEFGGQFHALCLSARERRCRLAKGHVVEADIAERLQHAADFRDVVEQTQSPRRTTFPTRRQSTGPDSERRASPGCSVCPCTSRIRPRRRARKCISMHFWPAPSQSSQRPPATLKLNRRAGKPRSFASGSWAKSCRISSKTPVYVAGLLLGELPSGRWSTRMTLLICSTPRIASWAPGCVRARCKRAGQLRRTSTSSISELFPLPETPAIAVSVPSGIETSMFFRLLCRAPRISIADCGCGLRIGRAEPDRVVCVPFSAPSVLHFPPSRPLSASSEPQSPSSPKDRAR